MPGANAASRASRGGEAHGRHSEIEAPWTEIARRLIARAPREYERLPTTGVNAYPGPVTQDSIDRLGDRLAGLGVPASRPHGRSYRRGDGFTGIRAIGDRCMRPSRRIDRLPWEDRYQHRHGSGAGHRQALGTCNNHPPS